MSDIKDGGPAFACAAFGPSGDMVVEAGMSLRDWYAGMALQGIAASRPNVNIPDEKDFNVDGPHILAGRVAALSYLYADAMIKARGEK